MHISAAACRGTILDALLLEIDFNVAHALVGTEETCAIVLGATVTAHPRQACACTPGARLPPTGYHCAADHVPGRSCEHRPVGLEGFDGVLGEMMRKRQWRSADQVTMLPPGDGWLLVEFGGGLPRRCRRAGAPSDGTPSRLLAEPRRRQGCSAIVTPTRRSSGRSARPHSACRPTHRECAPRMRDGRTLPWRPNGSAPTSAISAILLGGIQVHQRHVRPLWPGMRCTFGLISTSESVDGRRGVLALSRTRCRQVVSHGGAISGEHGDGQARAIFLGKMYGENLVRAFGALQVALGSRQPDEPGEGGASAAPGPGSSHPSRLRR